MASVEIRVVRKADRELRLITITLAKKFLFQKLNLQNLQIRIKMRSMSYVLQKSML